MNETEWLSCDNPWEMVELLERRGSDRKLLLFAVACCRRAWHLSDDPRHHEVVVAAERFADGLLSEAEFAEVQQPVSKLWASLPGRLEGKWGPLHHMTRATQHLGRRRATGYAASFAAQGLASLAAEEDDPHWLAVLQAEQSVQCKLLRDIFGSPFRPFQFDPAWLSGEGGPAVALARKIEVEGRFDELPVLADVIERAGCHDRAVLDHCRATSVHVRGCWVLDALLGRESAAREGLMSQADWRACEDPVPLLHFLRGKGTDRKWRLFAVASCRRIDRLITDERSRRAVEVAARYAEGAATEEELADARASAHKAQDEASGAEWSAEAEANFCVTARYAEIYCRLHAAGAARSAVCRDPRATDAESGSSEAGGWSPSHEWAVAARRWDVYASMITEARGWTSEAVQGAADAVVAAELRAHCEILRDLFGDYFGPPGGEGDWLPSGEGALESWCALPSPITFSPRREWMTSNGGAIPKLAREIYEEEAFDNLPILANALEEAGCGESLILDHLRGPSLHQRGCWVLDLLMGRSSQDD
jgi:uncharacterized membrane protein